MIGFLRKISAQSLWMVLSVDVPQRGSKNPNLRGETAIIGWDSVKIAWSGFEPLTLKNLNVVVIPSHLVLNNFKN